MRPSLLRVTPEAGSAQVWGCPPQPPGPQRRGRSPGGLEPRGLLLRRGRQSPRRGSLSAQAAWSSHAAFKLLKTQPISQDRRLPRALPLCGSLTLPSTPSPTLPSAGETREPGPPGFPDADFSTFDYCHLVAVWHKPDSPPIPENTPSPFLEEE